MGKPDDLHAGHYVATATVYGNRRNLFTLRRERSVTSARLSRVQGRRSVGSMTIASGSCVHSTSTIQWLPRLGAAESLMTRRAPHEPSINRRASCCSDL
jgi:hypothetical protein